MTEKGPIVVYRDRSSEEVRDIYATRLIEGAWTLPQPLHNDNWQIAGCPVNGPSVAAMNERVAVAWFTAKDDTPKIQLVVSRDSGQSFSDPIVVDSPNTTGRVGTALFESNETVITRMDHTEGSNNLRARSDITG